ncbi:MAG: hypothetical protein V4813_17935 [Gemmatimonadota bacterium]
MSRTAWVGMAVVAALGAGQPAGAQSAAPEVTLRGALLGKEPLDVSVNRSAYVTVFAVSHGLTGSSVQVLSPAAPDVVAPLRAGQRYAVRRLGAAQVVALGASSATQLIAFASDAAPNHSSFGAASAWHAGLSVPDSLASDHALLIRTLATELYAKGEPYAVLVQLPPMEFTTASASAQRARSPYAGCEGFDSDAIGSRRGHPVVLAGNTYGRSRDQRNGSDAIAYTMPITSYEAVTPNAPVRGERNPYIYDQRVQLTASQMPGGPQCTVTQLRPVPEPAVLPGNRPAAAPASTGVVQPAVAAPAVVNSSAPPRPN